MTVSFINQYALPLIMMCYNRIQTHLPAGLNVNKYSILQLSKHHHKSSFPYSKSGKLLKTVKQHSYLGILIDHHLSWNSQVHYVCSKAMRLTGFLQHNLRNCSKELKELSYKQFVLLILEYAATVRDPYHLCNVNKIEMIQHRAARFVLGEEILEIE